MSEPALNIGDHLAGIGLVPSPIKILRYHPELHYEIAGEVLGLDLAAFLAPQPKQRFLICAHNGPGVRAADKGATAPFPNFRFQSSRLGRECI
jgi:hypothetical protein